MDKATLRQYRDLLREIEELEHEKRRVLDRYLAPPQPTGMPGGSGNPDRLGEVAARREKYQIQIDEKLDELIELRAEIEAAIAGLPSAERRLIRLRYIQGRSWRWIGREMHYSEDWLWKLHGRILVKLREKE